jgi:hypothetical protein
MKKLLLKLLIFLSVFLIPAPWGIAQIGIQTDNPDPSSALDIVATNKGVLIPRVTLTNDLAAPAPINNPATGLLIYNSGIFQPEGFYYWNGTQWTPFTSEGGSLDCWTTTGNAGTIPGANFIGTTDSIVFAIYTNNTERLRVDPDGQIIIGATASLDEADVFTVIGSGDPVSAINAYSDDIGIYSNGGTFGLISFVENSSGYPIYSKNTNIAGYGGLFVGSNGVAYTLTNHSSGISAHGNDGIFTLGQAAATGIGIIAAGNNATTVSTVSTGSGGAFTGYHGLYSKASNASEGTGVIGVGNNGTTYSIAAEGSGGAFAGYHGVFATARNTNGTGVIGAGNNMGYHLMADGFGSGGAFTGYRTGVAGWADFVDNSSVGVFGQYNGGGFSRDGIGVKGVALANAGRGYGVYGQGNRYGLYSNGNTGASGTKSFVIDHPLDPENKILKHFSIESPEVLNLYRGKVVLDNFGTAEIQMPNYFISINIDFSYTLTPIGSPAPNLYVKEEIDENGRFTISGGNPNQKISWVVYAERNDSFVRKYPESKLVEEFKDESLKGKFIRPELYNQPPEKGIFYTPESRNFTPLNERESNSVPVEKVKNEPKQK